MELLKSMIWLLAGVGIFIVGMNFLSDALEKSAGSGMKKLLEKISNNRFSGVGIGAGVTALVQSSSATSVMVIGLVNAGVMTLMQATPIIYARSPERYLLRSASLVFSLLAPRNAGILSSHTVIEFGMITTI